jgi:hypothetical protein
MTRCIRHASTIWQNVDAFEKQHLFFLIFPEKLPYERSSGYQTAKAPSSTRLFEAFADMNPFDVEDPQERLDDLKDYLRRFWHYYISNRNLQRLLENADVA